MSFLLRMCIERGVGAAREHVETGLTCALDAVDAERDPCRRIAWIALLADASAVTDDPRLIDAVQRSLPAAVDDLEGLVRRTYEPGEGLIGRPCADHAQCATALLSCFHLCGRLPYGMLAEELMQSARRRWWDPDSGLFDAAFDVNCVAVQALCGLAALHADPDYVSAAVLAPDRPYADTARRMVATLTTQAADHPQDAAAFGRALLAWFALESNLQ